MSSNSPSQIHTARRKDFQRQIASLAREDRHDDIDGGSATLAGTARIESVADDGHGTIVSARNLVGHFGAFGHLPHLTEKIVNVRNPDSGTDVLVADMVEPPEHEFKQTHLERVGWSEIRVST